MMTSVKIIDRCCLQIVNECEERKTEQRGEKLDEIKSVKENKLWVIVYSDYLFPKIKTFPWDIEK